MKHELDLAGQTVREIAFDGRAHVHFGPYELIIEADCKVAGKLARLGS